MSIDRPLFFSLLFSLTFLLNLGFRFEGEIQPDGCFPEARSSVSVFVSEIHIEAPHSVWPN